jgi:hypothetical protein
MSTKNTTTRVPSRKSMTPEKYAKLPPPMRRAYDEKANAELQAIDDRIEKKRAKQARQSAEDLIELVLKTIMSRGRSRSDG